LYKSRTLISLADDLRMIQDKYSMPFIHIATHDIFSQSDSVLFYVT